MAPFANKGRFDAVAIDQRGYGGFSVRLLITAVGSLASIAIGLFAARPYIRRLYAPPNGKRRLRATWIGAVGAMAGSFLFDSDRAVLALIVFVSGPAIALVAMLLCRDAYNRARGLPADYVEIPEQLPPMHRTWFGLLSAGCAAAAIWLIGVEGWSALHAGWVFGGLAVGFGTAAARGRLSPKLRQRLGAAHPAGDLLERPADER